MNRRRIRADRRQVGLTVFAAVLMMGLVSASARGAAGDLDPSFGGDGRVLLDLPSAAGVAVDQGGRLIVGLDSDPEADQESGDLSVAALRPDGSLDPSFGSGGVATVLTEPHPAGGSRVEVDSFGRIVVGNFFVMTRLHPDGSVDTTFGDDGLLEHAAGPTFAVQPDGGIVLGAGGTRSFSFARYTSEGEPDNTFGVNGIATVPGPQDGHPGFGYGVSARDVDVLPDGRIIGVGTENYPAADEGAGMMAMVTPNGQPDPGFNSQGTPGYRRIGSVIYPAAVESEPDGQFVVAATLRFSNAIRAYRFNPDSTPDASFGQSGMVEARLRGEIFYGSTYPVGLGIQSDGKIVVGGRTGRSFSSNDQAFAVVRWDSNGNRDTGFGNNGEALTEYSDFSSAGDTTQLSPFALALDAKGNPVLAGGFTEGPLVMLRYLGEDEPPPAGGTGGVAGEIATSPGVEVHKLVIPKSRRKLAAKGVKVLASCDYDCQLVLQVKVSNGVAARMGLGSTLLARGVAPAKAGEREWVYARLAGGVARALRGLGGGGKLKIRVTGDPT